MPRIANQISERFDDDGQRFRTRDTDESLADVCAENGGMREANIERQLVSYAFSDGSCIILAGGGWDLLAPGCKCGWCWAGADELTCDEV
jgi:hypothetical protein